MLSKESSISRAIFDGDPSPDRRRPYGRQGLGAVAREFEQAAQGLLPIQAEAAEVALMDSRSGRWEINTTFRLGHES